MALRYFRAREKGMMVISLGEMKGLDLISKKEDDGLESKKKKKN